MANTKATGVAYADPQFESVTVNGPVAATGAVTGATVTASGAVTGGSLNSTTASGLVAKNAAGGVYFYTTAITANSTTTTAPKGSLGLTSNATGTGILFVSDGTKWQLGAITQA